MNTSFNVSASDREVGHTQAVNGSKEARSQSAIQANEEIEKPRTEEHGETKQKKEVDTEIFFFSDARLAALKAAVSAALPRKEPESATTAPTVDPGEGSQTAPRAPRQPSNGSVPDRVSHNDSFSSRSYISTNDALCALLFTCITAARSSTTVPYSSSPRTFRQPALPHTLPLSLAVSGRRLLNPPLPKDYIGNFSLFCHLNVSLPHLRDPTPAAEIRPTSSTHEAPQLDGSQQSPRSSAPLITPDMPTIAGIAYRIRARILELDDNYVHGLIGALSRVSDLSKVQPAFRDPGAPLLGQRRDDSKDSSAPGTSAKSAAGAEARRQDSSSPVWDLMITPWTAQGFYNMDWGAEMLGGPHVGHDSAKEGKEAHEGKGGGGGGVPMGRCERVRVPKVRWETMDGVCVVLPRLEREGGEGGLEVMVGLERGVMARLKARGEWRKYAERRCD